jgi:ABC-type uncharacterized transport system auxiliary subunit
MNSRFVKFATVATVAVAVLAGCQSNQPRYANYDPQPRYSDREGPRTVRWKTFNTLAAAAALAAQAQW